MSNHHLGCGDPRVGIKLTSALLYVHWGSHFSSGHSRFSFHWFGTGGGTFWACLSPTFQFLFCYLVVQHGSTCSLCAGEGQSCNDMNGPLDPQSIFAWNISLKYFIPLLNCIKIAISLIWKGVTWNSRSPWLFINSTCNLILCTSQGATSQSPS